MGKDEKEAVIPIETLEKIGINAECPPISYEFVGMDMGKPGGDMAVAYTAKLEDGKTVVNDFKIIEDEARMTEDASQKDDQDLAAKIKQLREDREAKEVQSLQELGLPYLNRDVYYTDEFGRDLLFVDIKTRISAPRIMLRKHRQLDIIKNRHGIIRVYVWKSKNVNFRSTNTFDVPEDAITIPDKKAAPVSPSPASTPVDSLPGHLKAHGAAFTQEDK